MTQTIRRKNCKTRREWAWNKSLKVWKGFRGGLIDYGERLLQAEHARAVRIVKADLAEVKRDQHNYSVVTKNELVKRLERLLVKLQKGRA